MPYLSISRGVFVTCHFCKVPLFSNGIMGAFCVGCHYTTPMPNTQRKFTNSVTKTSNKLKDSRFSKIISICWKQDLKIFTSWKVETVLQAIPWFRTYAHICFEALKIVGDVLKFYVLGR